jgi:hypothetical protein
MRNRPASEALEKPCASAMGVQELICARRRATLAPRPSGVELVPGQGLTLLRAPWLALGLALAASGILRPGTAGAEQLSDRFRAGAMAGT